MTERKKGGPWKPGQSGNPKGKTPGSGQLQKIRAALSDDVAEILTTLSTAAKSGDVQAARLILERVLPPIRAVEQAQALAIPAHGSLTDKAHAVLGAAASGELAPGQAAQLITALGTVAKIAEIDELAARVAALEKRHGNT